MDEELIPTPEDTPAPPAAPQPSLLHKIFIGPQGIRAGWGIAIAAAVFVGIARLTNMTVHHFRHGHPHMDMSAPLPARVMIIIELISVLFIAATTFIMSRIEKKPFTFYGLAGTRKLPHFAVGLFWGIVHISLLIGALLLTHHITIVCTHSTLHQIIRHGAAWFLCFLLVGIFEEMMFRGYLQWTLGRGIGFWWAAAILSFGFGFAHHTNSGESPVGLLSAGLVAFIFCLSIWYTRSLWWAIGFHAAWDWGQNFVYGTADSGLRTQGSLLLAHPQGNLWMSGGLTGPEGSVLVLPILALMALVIFLTLRKYASGNRFPA